MDPFSISASCATLIIGVTKATLSVTTFVREVRDARRDLAAVSQELLSLKTVLELLADDSASATSTDICFPPTIETRILGVLQNCNGVVAEIETCLQKHATSRLGKKGYWTIGGGKGDLAKLRSNLETHKSALEIGLHLVNVSATRDVKQDTEELRNNTMAISNDTAAIKDDTAQILREIAQLQDRLPVDAPASSTSNVLLQRYLNDLTSYAESMYDPSVPQESTVYGVDVDVDCNEVMMDDIVVLFFKLAYTGGKFIKKMWTSGIISFVPYWGSAWYPNIWINLHGLYDKRWKLPLTNILSHMVLLGLLFFYAWAAWTAWTVLEHRDFRLGPRYSAKVVYEVHKVTITFSLD